MSVHDDMTLRADRVGHQPGNAFRYSASEGDYRYWLSRGAPLFEYVLWIMLNPSTATQDVSDPTINRIENFSKQLAPGAGYYVVNLYALRSTNPKKLWLHEDPVGPKNDEVIKLLASEAKIIMCAWGAHAKPERAAHVMSLLDRTRTYCLGRNKDGSPKHPLYLRNDTIAQPYRGETFNQEWSRVIASL